MSADDPSGEGRCRQLEGQLASCQAQLERERAAREALLSSSSWRLTAPLRGLAAGFEGWRGRRGPVLPPGTSDPGSATTLADAFVEGCEPLCAAFLTTSARLDLRPAAEPRVSVVVVAPAASGPLFACLSSLRLALEGVPFEVVVVHHEAPEGTLLLLERCDGVVPLACDPRAPFGIRAGLGAEASRGPVLAFLDGEARLLPGALRAALSTLEASSGTLAVGGLTLGPDGLVEEAGLCLDAHGSPRSYGRGLSLDAPEVAFRRRVDCCGGSLLLTPRSLFDDLSGFPSDADEPARAAASYCRSGRRRGLATLYEPEAVVMRSSPMETDAAGDAPALHRRSADAGPRVLVVDDRVPLARLGEGFGRSARLLAALHRLGALVTLYTMTRSAAPLEQVYRDLPREVEVLTGQGAGGLGEFLAARRGFFDMVVVSRPHNLRLFLDVAGNLLGDGPHPWLVYDSEAVAALRDGLRGDILGRGPTSLQARRLVLDEVDLARRVDEVWTVSGREAQVMREGGASLVRVLGDAVTPSPTPRPFAGRCGFLLVGPLVEADSPNTDGLRWFLHEVLPLVDARLPGPVRVVVAGFRAPGVLDDLDEGRVTAPGFVDDLAPLYDATRVFVAPTRFAAGIPLKVLEAQAHGLPCVVTDLLAGQLALGADEAVAASAADPSLFADACVRLHSSPELWGRVREASLAYLLREFTPEAFDRTLGEALERALARCGEARP